MSLKERLAKLHEQIDAIAARIGKIIAFILIYAVILALSGFVIWLFDELVYALLGGLGR